MVAPRVYAGGVGMFRCSKRRHAMASENIVTRVRKDAEESTRMAAEDVRQFLPALARNPREVTEGEVLIHGRQG